MVEIHAERTEAGEHLKIVGSPLDADGFFADGISGLTIDSATAKVYFYEKLNDETGQLVGKVTAALTISRSGLDQLVDALTKAMNHVRTEEQKGQ